MRKSVSWLLSALFLVPLFSMSVRAENAGVPSECEDVMLQAFYWDSYTLTKYGRTKWVDLYKDTAAINANFDLVWFPPSGWAGKSTDYPGVGYYHRQLSNQTSEWGNATTLKGLIKVLHKGHTKVIADIVVNHRNNMSSWCDFYEDDFGKFGKFQLTEKHICRNDEGFTSSESNCYGSTSRGNADTGDNNSGCRDLDHTSEYVQSWIKAYLEWMKAEMGYDGFRYDQTLGYAGRYLGMYNESSQPCLSVSEYWRESASELVNHVKATGYNTMAFDFAQRATINTALRANNFRLLVKPSNSMRGQGMSRYAVTFIDNHDTFDRDDNSSQFPTHWADLSKADVKQKIMHANAYLLLMPGVPCVFWPHWKSYREDINALIAVRKLAGLHSESKVTEDCKSNVYEATIEGHRGNVILRMGAARSKEAPQGYHVAIEGGDEMLYTVFVQDGTGLENSQFTIHNSQCTKVLKDGQLYLKYGDKMYDVRGQLVNEN